MLRRAVTHVPHVPLPSSIRASGQPPVTALRCCANGARPRGWSNALEGGEGLSRALSGCVSRTPARTRLMAPRTLSSDTLYPTVPRRFRGPQRAKPHVRP
jgi:hypothetical protein